MSLADQRQQWITARAQVSVLRARGLRIKGKPGADGAHALLQVGGQRFSSVRAPPRADPVWEGQDAAFDLAGFPENGASLRVQVLQRALVGPDKLLGQTDIDLGQVYTERDTETAQWYKLVGKPGKPEKDRGEIMLDIQFLKGSMSASMFDLSSQDKSRSKLGKLKDKLRGKKKEGLSDSASAIVPSITQVMTDSEEEEEPAPGEKKKKNKLKSLFAPKSSLQRNTSQSMSTLSPFPDRDSAIASSASSGLNVESPEGKKKLKFLTHKRNTSADSKASPSGSVPQQSHTSRVQVYSQEPEDKGSTLSLSSSGLGSMEELRREKEERERLEEEKRRREAEKVKAEEERKREREAEEQRREAEKERMRLEREAEEQRREAEKERMRLEREAEEQRRKMEEKERMRLEREAEEQRRKMEEKERMRVAKEKEEQRKMEEEKERMRLEREAEEQRRKMEEKERMRVAKEKEEQRKMEEEKERMRLEREAEEQRREAEKEAEEQRRKMEEKERMRLEREAEEQRREAEKERMRMEREKEQRRKMEEQERMRVEREAEEQRRKMEEEKERMRMEREKEEQRKMEEEKERMRVEREKEEQRKMEEEKERMRMEREKEQRKMEEKERMRMEREAEEQRRKMEEKERMRVEREKEQRRKMEEEKERMRIEREAEEKRRKMEEERKRVEEEENRRLEKEKKVREEEADKHRREEERRVYEEEERERRRKEEEMERLSQEEERRMKMKEEEKKAQKLEDGMRTEERPVPKARSAKVSPPTKPARLQQEPSSNPSERSVSEGTLSLNPFEEPTTSQPSASVRSARVSTVKPSASISGTFSQPPAINTNPFLDDDASVDESLESISSTERSVERTARKGRAPLPPQNKLEMPKPAVPSGAFQQEETKEYSFKEVSKRQAPLPPGGLKKPTEEPVGFLDHSIFGEGEKKTPAITGKHLPSKIAPVSKDELKAWCDQSLTARQNSAPQKMDPSDDQSIMKQNNSVQVTRHAALQINQSQPEEKQADTNPFRCAGPVAKPNKGPAPAKPLLSCLSSRNSEEERSNHDSVESTVNLEDKANIPLNSESTENPNLKEPEELKSLVEENSKPEYADMLSRNATSTDALQVNPSGGGESREHLDNMEESNGPHSPDRSSSIIKKKPRAPLPPVTTGLRVVPCARVVPTDAQGDSGEVKGAGGAPPSVNRPHAVKPLNAADKQSDLHTSKATGPADNLQPKAEAAEPVGKGPYSQLTRAELVSLLVRQQEQLSQRDFRILELEQYIDNLLVRVMEEQPSILMSITSQKKAA